MPVTGRLRTLGIVTAMPIEASPFIKKNRWISLGDNLFRTKQHSLGLTLVISGLGAKRARKATKLLIERTRPFTVISVGLSAGLTPELKPRAMLLASSVNHDNSTLNCSGEVYEIAKRELKLASVPVYCPEAILLKAKDKQNTHKKTGAWAADLESYHVAETANSYRIPWACIRGISDSCEENLPYDFQALLNNQGFPSLPKTLSKTLISPHNIPQLIRLGLNSKYTCNLLSELIFKLTAIIQR